MAKKIKNLNFLPHFSGQKFWISKALLCEDSRRRPKFKVTLGSKQPPAYQNRNLSLTFALLVDLRRPKDCPLLSSTVTLSPPLKTSQELCLATLVDALILNLPGHPHQQPALSHLEYSDLRRIFPHLSSSSRRIQPHSPITTTTRSKMISPSNYHLNRPNQRFNGGGYQVPTLLIPSSSLF